jgi:hypothetical protein
MREPVGLCATTLMCQIREIPRDTRDTFRSPACAAGGEHGRESQWVAWHDMCQIAEIRKIRREICEISRLRGRRRAWMKRAAPSW